MMEQSSYLALDWLWLQDFKRTGNGIALKLTFTGETPGPDVQWAATLETQGLQEHRESAIIKLWEAGHLSTREAAKQLKLTYQGYLGLLTQRGVPILRQEPRPEVIEAALQHWREESA